jgi:poly-beta-1,6-N-acetyl-D-glucosamine synthase
VGDRVGVAVEPVPVSVGVIAYNEEANIGQILDALLRQRTERVRIAEIVVVSSGSTDRTDAIVREVGARSPLVRLIAEPQREGKASAVNTFLAAAASDLLVLASADIVPDGDAVEQLCLPFEDPTVGITGARPVPTNRTDTFAGIHAHVLYALRHEISLEALKTGELLAFRRVVPFLPSHSSVDEDWIHIAVERAGYRGRYVPTARCFNHGPETVREIVRQRVRLVAGELALVGEYGWACPTMKRSRVLRLLLKQLRHHRPRTWPWVLAVAPLEAYIRLRAWRLLLTRGEDFRWEPATTSKRVALDRIPRDPLAAPSPADPAPTLAGSPD